MKDGTPVIGKSEDMTHQVGREMDLYFCARSAVDGVARCESLVSKNALSVLSMENKIDLASQ